MYIYIIIIYILSSQLVLLTTSSDQVFVLGVVPRFFLLIELLCRHSLGQLCTLSLLLSGLEGMEYITQFLYT